MLIDVTSEDIQNEYETLLKELNTYSEELSKKRIIVAFSKIDLIDEKELKKLMGKIEKL